MIAKSLTRKCALWALAAGTLLSAANTLPTLADKATTTTITSSSDSADLAPVLAQVAALTKALASSDSAALSSLWSATGQYVDKDGEKYAGRDMLQKRFATLFSTEGKRFVELAPESTKFLSSDIAYTEGKVLVGEKKIPETRYVILLVKHDGTWLIESATEVPLANTDKVVSTGLNDLAWIVGSWEVENAGAHVSMKSHWDADKHLIECRYEISRTNEPTEIDLQVIGFDTNNHRPVSWHFDSNGSYGFGTWFQRGDHWLIESNGIEPDGKISSATNIMQNIRPDGFTWQSVDRHVSGVHLPDTTALTVKRVQSTADSSK